MYSYKLEKKIIRRKFLLNFVLNFLSPTNILVIKLSENLDKLIVKQQKYLLKKHLGKSNLGKKRLRGLYKNIA
ncbi:hypothetical protein CFOLD11_24020 [Clostridium folliculivorans]|uniref:Uncharacterized protein n=1 Tax=Clostridium folliculivorans TaxID=2886038 RepID=A0A9W6DB27_9CLOT|nr:hypothetical protein [Clostridium folliculivorans]GKU25576.1 hypothetical protein CFOLD11_24020 [Clostridium folliculivorans]